VNRIGRHQMFMQIAEVVSRRSTCFRRNVGAVIVERNNIIGVGYNGPASGEAHCTGNGCAHPVNGCQRAVHAEANALDRASGRIGQWSMYVTESPCPACAEAIADSDIANVYFLHLYRLTYGLELLQSKQINLWRMTPSGYITNYATGELVEGA
jgi:dCMP deaminase